MRAGRWILLLLYLALVGGLSASLLTTGDGWAWFVVGVTLSASAVFILGAGHRDLFRPIGRPRLFFPVVAASLMLTALLGGLVLSLIELFDFHFDEDDTWTTVAFWGSLLATWVFWGVVLCFYTHKMTRHQAISHMARLIFAGSIAELLAGVPSHIIVSKRGGCFAGILTATGLFAGVMVMIWSFGPAIFLLFLREAHRDRDRGKATVTAPSTRKLPQFHLRALMIAMLLLATVCALLRSFWGEWPVAMIVAWGILLLTVPLLLTRAWIMLVGYVAVFAGLIYCSEGEWWPLAFVLPTGLLGIVMLKLVMFDSTVLSAVQNDPIEPEK